MSIPLLRFLVAFLVWLVPRLWASIPEYLPFYVLVAVVIYAGIKARRHTTVISPFHLPPGSTLPFGEHTVANVLRDALVGIHKEAEAGLRARSGELIGVGPADLAGLKLPELSELEVPTRFAVEVRGFSHEGLISLARKVRGKERIICGDVVLDGKDLRLVARTSDGGPWSSGPSAATAEGLQQACRELGLNMLETLDPTLLAAQEAVRREAESAHQRLRAVVGEPGAPESSRRVFEVAAVLASVELDRKGKGKDSLELLEEAACLLPRSALLAYGLGVTWHESKRAEALTKAVANYRRALKLRPKFPEALTNLGNALGDKGQLDEAIACYQKALAIKPDHVSALNNLGIALADKGQLDEAIACFNKGLELKPDDPGILNNLGQALAQKAQLDEAIACFNKALKIKPDDHEVLNNLGNALRQKGQLDEAIACFNKALKIKPDDHEVLNNLGRALAQKAQLDEAIACFNKALKIKPDDHGILNNLGIALYHKGQLDEAIANFQKALKLKPDFARARYNLGLALRRKGDRKGAAREFAEAQRLDPKLKPPPEPAEEGGA